jgi:hypothetical protein
MSMRREPPSSATSSNSHHYRHHHHHHHHQSTASPAADLDAAREEEQQRMFGYLAALKKGVNSQEMKQWKKNDRQLSVSGHTAHYNVLPREVRHVLNKYFFDIRTNPSRAEMMQLWRDCCKMLCVPIEYSKIVRWFQNKRAYMSRQHERPDAQDIDTIDAIAAAAAAAAAATVPSRQRQAERRRQYAASIYATAAASDSGASSEGSHWGNDHDDDDGEFA